MLLAYYMYLGNTTKRKKMHTQDVWNLLNTVYIDMVLVQTI